MKEFMRIICVILCLIISTTVYAGSITTTAYAESILWATKQSSTNLIKDEEWLADALLAEEPDANHPAEDAEAAPLEITMDVPEKILEKRRKGWNHRTSRNLWKIH